MKNTKIEETKLSNSFKLNLTLQNFLTLQHLQISKVIYEIQLTISDFNRYNQTTVPSTKIIMNIYFFANKIKYLIQDVFQILKQNSILRLRCKKMDNFFYNCLALWGRDICILFCFMIFLKCPKIFMPFQSQLVFMFVSVLFTFMLPNNYPQGR